MKFLYSDTQDFVDPDYDFINDRSLPGHKGYWDDQYAHEMMNPAPYDGLLVSMSAIRQADGVAKSKVRYSTAEEQRMLREGARKFLRFDGPMFADRMLMGDCGAFAYVEHPQPAYSPTEVMEFYRDVGFSHGVSPDHIIFECDIANPDISSMESRVHERYEITQSNAYEFLQLAKNEGMPFEPMGAVQGWSPASMAIAANNLEKMGYRYLAIGGLVPLKVEVIHEVLKAIRGAIRPETNIHLLGFAKADKIHEFTGYGITSFDSTSPLIAAFKDEKKNYYIEKSGGGIEYYAAIRIPQSLENTRLMRGIKEGRFNAESLQKMEAHALSEIRLFHKTGKNLETTLEAICEYQHFLTIGNGKTAEAEAKTLIKQQQQMRRTLEAQPWKECGCDICRDAGVEVIIFRASNRNKRRGMHNLGIYHRHLHKTLKDAE